MVTTMRSALFFAVVSVTGFWAAPAWPVSPDELRALSGVTEREEQQRANRVKTSDPKTLLPVQKAPAATSPQSNKYGQSPTPERNNTTRDIGGQTRDIPGSGAILVRVMWPSTPAGRQCLA